MRILPNLPNQNQMENDIIQVLKDLGGKATRSEVIGSLVKKWQLTSDEVNYRTPGGYVYYEHRIDGVANKLRNEGKIITSERGVWQYKVEPPPPPDEAEKLAEEIKNSLEKLVELAKKAKGKEPPLPSHDELVQMMKEMGEMLGKTAEGPWGPIYRRDCVWKDNPYANPKIVVEVCDKGNLDKDIASLLWAVKNWGARGILVVFGESDFQAAQRKLAQENQIYPLRAADVLTLHSLAKAGNVQAIRSIFGV
jgi:hypothetical protein